LDQHAVHRFLGRKLLIELLPRRRFRGHKQTIMRAVHTGAPTPSMTFDLAVFVRVGVFTEVIDIVGGLVDSQEVPRNFGEFAVGPFALFDDARLYAIDGFGLIRHRNDELSRFAVLGAFKSLDVSGLKDAVVVLAGRSEVRLGNVELVLETILRRKREPR